MRYRVFGAGIAALVVASVFGARAITDDGGVTNEAGLPTTQTTAGDDLGQPLGNQLPVQGSTLAIEAASPDDTSPGAEDSTTVPDDDDTTETSVCDGEACDEPSTTASVLDLGSSSSSGPSEGNTATTAGQTGPSSSTGSGTSTATTSRTTGTTSRTTATTSRSTVSTSRGTVSTSRGTSTTSRSTTTTRRPTTSTTRATTTTRQQTTTSRATTTTRPRVGDPLTCSSVSATFCEDFEGGRSSGGRNGDLSSSRFSLARWRSEGLNTGPNYVGRSDVSGCRSGLGLVLPPNDSLICDPSGSIASRHAIVATAQQDYGDNLVRINQPFDFRGRTGTFAFDLSLPTYGLLGGFPHVIFTEDPMAAPSYLTDNSGGPTPRNGFAVQFKSRCGSGVGAVVLQYTNHSERQLSDTSGCPAQPRAVAGQMNRIEIRVSQSRIEIWASQPSSNGVDFAPMELMFSGSITQPATRGHLYFGVHNHATVKYLRQPSVSARWDNLVFDGPRIATTRVAQVNNASFSGGGGVDLSYSLSETGTGVLSLPGVSKQSNARLVFNTWMDTLKNTNVSAFEVQYRFNGGQWRSKKLTAGEIAQTQNRRSGSFSWSFPVDTGDLRSGTNTIEMRGRGFSVGAGARVGNIDLVTS